MQVKKQQLEPDREQWIGSKSVKEYVKAVYCHPAYLIYMQSTSSKMMGWMKHKLESRLPRYINNLRYADDTTLMAESEELKSLLMKGKEESEKLNIQKPKIMASGLITSWQIDGETMETVSLYFGRSKITADGDCSHEIKRCLLLGRKAMTNLVCVLVAQSCLTLCNPMYCSLSGSSIYGILQARILKWIAVPLSRVSS